MADNNFIYRSDMSGSLSTDTIDRLFGVKNGQPAVLNVQDLIDEIHRYPGPTGPIGPQGAQGDKGKDGTGVKILDSADSCKELGDAYINQDNGHLMILTKVDPKEFTDGGLIQGPQGPTGPSDWETLKSVLKSVGIEFEESNGKVTKMNIVSGTIYSNGFYENK